jgi:hypothetical protein
MQGSLLPLLLVVVLLLLPTIVTEGIFSSGTTNFAGISPCILTMDITNPPAKFSALTLAYPFTEMSFAILPFRLLISRFLASYL